MKKEQPSLMCIILCICQLSLSGQAQIENNLITHTIKIPDKNGNLVLNINYGNKCVIDFVGISGYAAVDNREGVISSVKSNGKWYSSASSMPLPKVNQDGDRIIIKDIIFGEENCRISEKWVFQSSPGYIDWTIERTYLTNTTLEDAGFPQWAFNNMDTWTGALLGTGGVAWCKFFDEPNASLGNHTGEVTFWNQKNKACLNINPVDSKGLNTAVRFSRQPDNRFTLNYSVSEEQLRTKHFLSRFIIDRQDIWDMFDVRGTAKVTYRLKALNYDDVYYRGDFPGINGESVRSLLNTIARVGVIDEKLMGSNNWHLDMGFVCLHEQWIAQMGLAINDPLYLGNYRKSLDYYRDNAISPAGNVKDRWAYRIWDSEPGTFDNGFYECQWGDLLDSNTDYVINVAGLFQINGDLTWVMSHKLQCEKVLGFLLKRDSDNDGLIEAFTDSHTGKKGSDWIDVIWASYENAFLNAKLYDALIQWSEIEELSGDSEKAGYYRLAAEKCKNRFNQPVSEGGFWSPENEWYVYWRDKDESIHGDNLVTPVNFMAIAYGICDDENRKRAVLKKIETLMQKEKLFMWPISFFPYNPDEGLRVNYPFPNYENGDIFLAWGEVGIRAYQDQDPAIPVKYIKNVLAQYEKDGLAFQRYDRLKQEGQGSDILANNCLPVVGLYRDIYGVQPQYNRLFLEPHLTPELNGTKLKYWLREQYYTILLSENDYSMSANSFTINSNASFGMSAEKNKLKYFKGNDPEPSLTMSCDNETDMVIKIPEWNSGVTGIKKWSVKSASGSVKTEYEIALLKAGSNYSIMKNGMPFAVRKSDNNGRVSFSYTSDSCKEDSFEIKITD
jgi:hypothetical protein